MEMRASQVIKGALGGGAKKKKKGLGEKQREKKKRRDGRRHLQIHIGREVWKLRCHSCLASDKGHVTFGTFEGSHHRFSSRNRCDSFKHLPYCSLALEQKLILSH